MSEQPKTKLKAVCVECGGTACEIRRYLEWDMDKQEYVERSADSDGSYCFHCAAVDRGVALIPEDTEWETDDDDDDD